jgi:hypothetical protein
MEKINVVINNYRCETRWFVNNELDKVNRNLIWFKTKFNLLNQNQKSMKKSTLLVAALAFGATSAFAQYTNKNGLVVTPETGDYAIGVDATPFLGYFGNMLNGNTNNGAPAWGFTNNNAMITGKKFTSETMAYRAALRIGFGSTTMTNPVEDDTSNASPKVYTEDKMKSSGTFIGLGGGLEWRRGKNRLQGYWGGMAMVGFGSGKTTYTYGNAFSSSNQTPTSTTDFTGTIDPTGEPTRTTETKSGTMIMFGLRGFVGAEYFVLPKLSIGGEFGWGLAFQSQGAGSKTEESWDSGNSTATSTTTETGKMSSFGIDTDNSAFGMAPAAILIHFHF